MNDRDKAARRINYRGRYRGMREMDRLMGCFLDQYDVINLSTAEIEILEAFVNESDPVLENWIKNPKTAPALYHGLIANIVSVNARAVNSAVA